MPKLKHITSGNNDFWTLTYALPETMLGGVPIVTTDKRTCKIVRIVHTQ